MESRAAGSPGLARLMCRRLRKNRAATLGFPGVWLLNNSYQCGCTSLAREREGVPWLRAPRSIGHSPGLPPYGCLPHKGPAGEYFSVTWPGYAGVLTRWHRHRFGACINQAPMWRRTPASLAATLRPCRQRAPHMGECSPHAAGSAAAPGLRTSETYCSARGALWKTRRWHVR